MNDLSKTITGILAENLPPIGYDIPHKYYAASSEMRPLDYKETFLKSMADDIATQINEKSIRQIESLERMAEDSERRVKLAEQNLTLHEKQLALYEQELEDARKDTASAARRSWIAIGISLFSIAVSIAIAAINSGWIK